MCHLEPTVLSLKKQSACPSSVRPQDPTLHRDSSSRGDRASSLSSVTPSATVRNLGLVMDNQEESIRALDPSALHIPPRILQLAPGWTPGLRDQTFAAYPECRSTSCVNVPKFHHVIPPFLDLHWIPVVASIISWTLHSLPLH